MNISILVFGNDEFLATLPSQIIDADNVSIEAIADLQCAMSRIRLDSPDVIIVQSSQNDSMQLCSWLSEQTKLSWIYCILLEDSPELITERRNQPWEWELEMTSKALKLGADAYIWYGDTQEKESIRQRKTDSATNHLSASHRLLLSQLAVAWRKAQKYQDLIKSNDALSTIALADSLTELNNRRALEWDLPRQIKKARDENSPLSLIILDVDYFKRVNDNHGHLVGDRLLKLLSSRIKHNLRAQDTAFRYGGEEFVIILADTNAEEADVVANRLKTIVKEKAFAINSSLNINVTISLGAACLLSNDDEQGLNLLHRADTFLLEAKSKGRNCVVSSSNIMQDNNYVANSTDNCLRNEVNCNSPIKSASYNNHTRTLQSSHL
ncbi:MAG: diguanylate cyclase [Rivularia sp. (in: cyanobacteria)]|jgi:two-component system cell cycle response regulator